MEQRKGGFSASGTNFSERSYQLKIKRQKKQKFTKKRARAWGWITTGLTLSLLHF